MELSQEGNEGRSQGQSLGTARNNLDYRKWMESYKGKDINLKK